MPDAGEKLTKKSALKKSNTNDSNNNNGSNNNSNSNSKTAKAKKPKKRVRFALPPGVGSDESDSDVSSSSDEEANKHSRLLAHKPHHSHHILPEEIAARRNIQGTRDMFLFNYGTPLETIPSAYVVQYMIYLLFHICCV